MSLFHLLKYTIYERKPISILVLTSIIIVIIFGLEIFQQSIWAYYIETTIPWSHDKIKDGILTYKVESTDEIFKTLVKNAFSEWQKKLKYISFKEVTVPESWFNTSIGNTFIDITVKQTSYSEPDYYSYSHGLTKLELDYDSYRYRANIFLFLLEDVFNKENKQSLQSLILHEIGHALGLGHSTDDISLMSVNGGLLPIVSDCDAYFVLIANKIYQKESIDTATKEGCDLIYEYDKREGSIQYVSTYDSIFKIKFPADLQWNIYNLTHPMVLKLSDISPMKEQSLYKIEISVGELDSLGITLENFEELYPDYYIKIIKEKSSKHIIVDSQITLLKDYKIHKIIVQTGSTRTIVITLPISDNKPRFLQIISIYDKNNESYFLPLFQKILDSLELLPKTPELGLNTLNQSNSSIINTYKIGN